MQTHGHGIEARVIELGDAQALEDEKVEADLNESSRLPVERQTVENREAGRFGARVLIDESKVWRLVSQEMRGRNQAGTDRPRVGCARDVAEGHPGPLNRSRDCGGALLYGHLTRHERSAARPRLTRLGQRLRCRGAWALAYAQRAELVEALALPERTALGGTLPERAVCCLVEVALGWEAAPAPTAQGKRSGRSQFG